MVRLDTICVLKGKLLLRIQTVWELVKLLVSLVRNHFVMKFCVQMIDFLLFPQTTHSTRIKMDTCMKYYTRIITSYRLMFREL